jgi:hypothetical protein
MRQIGREARGSGAADQAGTERDLVTLARRRGYADGLVALGVPGPDAERRASERYP